jgi:hypothetical protein
VQIDPGKDYYVALAFDLKDLSEDGVVFYVKNLTDGGDLEVKKLTRKAGADTMVDTDCNLTIGNSTLPTAPWMGVIDEVKISGSQLGLGNLLVSKELVIGDDAEHAIYRNHMASARAAYCSP